MLQGTRDSIVPGSARRAQTYAETVRYYGSRAVIGELIRINTALTPVAQPGSDLGEGPTIEHFTKAEEN